MSLLSCKKHSELLSQAMDRPMSPWEKFCLKFHAALCFTCRRFHRQLEVMDRALKGLPESKESHASSCECLSSEAAARMKQCLAECDKANPETSKPPS